MGSIEILSVASTVPEQHVASKDILNQASKKVSPQALEMLEQMDIENRYSIIENYPEYLCGKCERKIMIGVNDLVINSINKCVARFGHDLNIGLLIAVTNTAERPLPCMAYEILSKTEDNLLPHDINIINMQNQGCSALIKAFELASYFLQANPDKQVVVCVGEAHTAMVSPTLSGEKIFSFREIKEFHDNRDQKKAASSLNNLINSYLFGDGAVSFLLGHRTLDDGFESYHLTNIEPSDSEILAMNEGGSKIPTYENFPQYVLGRTVPVRGAAYSRLLLEQFLKKDKATCPIEKKDINYFLIHTGSKKIIDAVQKNLNLQEQEDKIAVSYAILKNYGNLSSCSIGFMLDTLINKMNERGNILLISFGVGFSGSVAKLKI
ncbi:3-oxoacyl-ACP synthase [Fluoribacter dumoffii]|uniref:Alpha-pyrone synthesis polyketide synthase-like Pks18 n=2 Tax=Fluoribacter dumoffii TaxID=463 RepID=A0A377G8Y1_9GAMM|nr:3-oxoacyl-[acyl-carrier-protein] synthase III C-terminal domain-containing protein [Fluoribacter dumoffii]KTC90157.1 Naringenin-chalcone synthase [Fluoribacter dumoffii NY 23]MCW8496251.1 3-oxoacyl-ACP synthase [Fluoribacter dumoffii]STO21276.1 Alpha-pyrone synthesis polyketide synthase-like Pks18 [Fluoribacter dumoffii]